MKKSLIKIIPTAVLITGITTYAINSIVSTEYKAIRENLENGSIKISEFKIPEDRYAWIYYKDKDKNGKFESYLIWKNPKGDMAEIEIKKQNNEYIYPNLDESAIKPDFALAKEHDIEYTDLNFNGKLESKLVIEKK